MNEKAKWIRGEATEEYEAQRHAFAFRKEIILPEGKTAVGATITASALGIFKIYMGGREISSDRFAPGWSNYDNRVYSITYDIGDFIAEKFCVGVTLGNGWYAGKVGAVYRDRVWGNIPEFIAEVNVRYSDGTTDNFFTDGSWKVSDCAVRFNDLFDGETVDDRYSVKGFSSLGYGDSAWQNAVVSEREEIVTPDTGSAAKVICRLPAVSEREINGKIIYDFGQNIAGAVRITVNGGGKVTVRYAEVLDESGLPYFENLRTAKATDTFITAKSGVFEPIFTYHGFRYAIAETSGGARIDGIEAVVVSSLEKVTGAFSCSNEIINKIYKNVLWGTRDNFVWLPTDCPQRDERLGWTGDAQIISDFAAFSVDCSGIFRRYAKEMADGQFESGAVPVFVPMMKQFEFPYGFSAWSDAVAIIPYRCFLVYGDRGILEETFPAMEKWIAYCLSESDGYIMPAKGYGDWLSIGNGTDKSLSATAFFANSARIVSRVCDILSNGKKEYYEDLEKNIKAAFSHKFACGGRLTSDTFTAYAVAYKFGMTDSEFTAENLSRLLAEKRGNPDTGFVGTRYLPEVLCETGFTDEAYKIMASTDFPSLGFMVKNGATTVWERWNGYMPGVGFNDPAMNSFNHFALGACAVWFYEYVLGIRITEENVNLSAVVLKPFLDGSGTVKSARGSFRGVSVEWERLEENVYIYMVTYPENMRLTCDFGDFKVKHEDIGKGRSAFTLIK